MEWDQVIYVFLNLGTTINTLKHVFKLVKRDKILMFQRRHHDFALQLRAFLVRKNVVSHVGQ
jgi:hypothetical protein